MIAYDVKEAQAAFAALANILKKTAKTKLTERKVVDLSPGNVGKIIGEIIEADPMANAIRRPFEKAWTLARDADDTETEKNLRFRHARLIEDFNAIGAADGSKQSAAAEKYATSLKSHAAWICAFGRKIGKPATIEEQDIAQKLDDLKADTTAIKKGVAETRNAAAKVVDELALWHKWIESGCKFGGKRNGKSSNAPKLLKPMRDAILDKWQKYNAGDADCELPNGQLRTAKRTIAEFYEGYSAAIIYTSKTTGKMWTLKQMCPKVEHLNTAIDSAQKAMKRAANKGARRITDKKIK